MEETIKYKRRWYQSLLVILLLEMICVGFCFIINDQTQMQKDAYLDYQNAMKTVSELSNQLNQKTAEVNKLQNQLAEQPK